jgi:hypothetical protein
MLYAFLCYHDEAVVNGWTKEEDDAALAKRAQVTDKLRANGKLGPALRLMPTTAATTVRMGREPVILDGPFAETKEALLGFWVFEAANLDEAIGIAREFAGHSPFRGGALEVRPVRDFNPGAALK